MKKITITASIILSLSLSAIALAKAVTPSLAVQTWVLPVGDLMKDSVHKFIDGNVACYTFQVNTGDSISCVKIK